MKIYKDKNVWDEALDRIRFIFDEFPVVIAGISGGKDSTVTMNLALKVAEEKGRLPLKVLFLDQEAEWETVTDHIREVMKDPRIEPLWVQIPFKIFNATSHTEHWLNCWEEGKEDLWMRPKEPNSIKVNKYGTDRFADMFTKYMEVEYPNQKACYLAGVRAEESPTRFVTLTSIPKYKHITYGKTLNKKKEHFTFYPLYDWSYTDIWKAILDNNWPYCPIYDYQYQHGIPVREMRVSNLHHETAVKSLYYLQEIEGDTWNKLTKRVTGISTAGHLKSASSMAPKELPPMFTSWREYRDYLLDNLVSDSEYHKLFKRRFELMDDMYKTMKNIDVMYQVHITGILANDFSMTKISNWERAPEVDNFRKYARDGTISRHSYKNKYIMG